MSRDMTLVPGKKNVTPSAWKSLVTMFVCFMCWVLPCRAAQQTIKRPRRQTAPGVCSEHKAASGWGPATNHHIDVLLEMGKRSLLPASFVLDISGKIISDFRGSFAQDCGNASLVLKDDLLSYSGHGTISRAAT
ncbi:MAG: hypothetical protein ABJQ90_18770 [Parasphingorhabdus sp.]